MKNRTKIHLALSVALSLTIAAAHAQTAPTVAPLVAPAVVADQVPPPVVSAPAVASPQAIVVPVAEPSQVSDPTATMAADDMTRDISRLRTRVSVIDAMMDLDQAQVAREKAQIQAQLDLLELKQKLANDGREPSEQTGPEPGTPAALALAVMLEPQPVVRSIYGYAGDSFAEIYVGSAKIIATEGTVLSTGARVVKISPAGVVIVKRGRRSVLQVAGSAGTQPSAAPSYSGQGLPPRP